MKEIYAVIRGPVPDFCIRGGRSDGLVAVACSATRVSPAIPQRKRPPQCGGLLGLLKRVFNDYGRQADGRNGWNAAPAMVPLFTLALFPPPSVPIRAKPVGAGEAPHFHTTDRSRLS